MPQLTRSFVYVCVLVLMIVIPVFGQRPAAPEPTPQVLGSVRIAWEGKPRINRYRLQLSRNEQFSDIAFDKLVQGREYTVTEIAPGKYFWRVAPAAGETGAYSKPLPVTVDAKGSTEPPKPPPPVVLSPSSDVGWRTATGLVDQPQIARLRAGSGFDVIGVNNYGMVYAITGENGVALWSARYRPGAKKGEPVNSDGGSSFTPLLVEMKDKTSNVLAAFDGGIRALEGATGRELWRAELPGEALNGITLAPQEDGSVVAVVFDDSRTLTYLKGDSGQIISQSKLSGLIVGRPAEFSVKGERGVLMCLNNGTIEFRNLAGVSTLGIKVDAPVTTGPAIVRGPKGQIVMIGTDAGLIAFDPADLNPLWRVATEGDSPHGMLTQIDLEADGTEDIVMITRRGRTVVVNIGTGRIKWYADGATDAMKATFADVNGDSMLDVLVAGGAAFALGFSGKDGALIWRADEPGQKADAAATTTSQRVLIAVPVGNSGSAFLVGSDVGRTGLRAVGLPTGSMK